MTYTIKGSFITCLDCDENWEHICPLCKATPYGSLGVKNKPKSRSKKSHRPKAKNRIPPNQPLPISHENYHISTFGEWEEIEIVPRGFTRHFKSKGSEYFINEAKDVLIRKSDHWGSSIAFCTWYLKGYRKIPCYKWQSEYGKEPKIGRILFSELDIHRTKTEIESRHPV